MSAFEAAVLALIAAACWGISDYLGGRASARRSASAALSSSQLVSVLALLAAVASCAPQRAWLPDGHDLVLAVTAAAGGMIGTGALYWALARGPAAVVAPGSALLSSLLPVAVGIALVGAPPPIVLAGVATAMVAAVLLAGPGRGAMSGPLLAATAVSGLGFAVLPLAMGGVHHAGLPVVAAGAVAGLLLVTAGLVVARTPVLPALRPTLIDAACGLLRGGGTVAFSLAAVHALVITAALAALFPAGTLLCDAVLTGRRPSRVQATGAALAVAAGVLVAAG